VKEAKILIVDDDIHICEILKVYFEKEMYKVIVSNNGQDALNKFYQENPNIVILDIMMPIMDGWQVCREIRKTSNCPIIMLTAKGEIFDKVLGLELGADDYITKPFETKEVVARVKAVLRRTLYHSNTIRDSKCVEYENLIIDITKYELQVKGKVVELPPKELELLFFLASNANKVFTRNQLLDELWGIECYVDTRTVDVHIKRLREKLENVSEKWELKTVWGVGYKFETKN
jgi:DNA-binding response OmpR family regulator